MNSQEKFLKYEKGILLEKNNLVFREVFEKVCLVLLLAKKNEWFLENFSGELSTKNYLLKRNGTESHFLPSHGIPNIQPLYEVAVNKFESIYQNPN